MDPSSKKTLKETVERAKKEIEKLLAEAQTGKPDTPKLKAGLKAVQKDLEVMDWHLDKPGS
jgi:hypothetical protein